MVARDRGDVQRGDAGLLHRGEPLADVALGADERHLLQQLVRDLGGGLVLLAVQVEVLDLLGLLLEAVPAGEVVVEVLALGAHAADVQRGHRAAELQVALHVVADGERGLADDVELAQRGVALGLPRGQGGAPHVRGLLRHVEDRLPGVGDLGGQLDVLRADRGDHDGDALAHRVVDELEGLAEAGALPLGQRQLVVLAVVLDALAPPHLAADVDDLAGAAERRGVGHAVEALDDLRPGRADAEREPPAGDVVQARGGLRERGRRAGVDVEDAGGDLQPLGLGGDVAHLAHRVEAVRLRDVDDVEAGLLVVGQLLDGLLETSGVAERHPDAHRRPFP